MQRSLIPMVMFSMLAIACTGGGGGGDEAADEGGSESSGSESGGGETGPSKTPTLPPVDGVMFVAVADNQFLPWPVGAVWNFETVTEEGTEHVQVTVTMDTKTIEGVAAIVVHDVATLNDQVIEDTHDWYAQDEAGNVWYLGEDTCEFTNGMCTDVHGTWTWGVDGALPGIVMPATPTVDGQPYYEEYLVGEAEDAGEVIELNVHVEVPAGSFDGCVKTQETSTLELTVIEYKTYCPGVGLVLTEEDGGTEQLVSYTLP